MKQYRQCRLRRGTSETVGWIETRGARQGVSVEMLPGKELWEVIEVFGYTMPEDLLKRHQRMHRNSLLSVEPMGAPAKQVGKVK